MIDERIKNKIERCQKYVNYPDEVWSRWIEIYGEEYLDDVLRVNGEHPDEKDRKIANIFFSPNDVVKLAAYIDFAHECMDVFNDGEVQGAIQIVYRDLCGRFFHDIEAESEFFTKQHMLKQDYVNVFGKYSDKRLNKDSEQRIIDKYLDQLESEGYFHCTELSSDEIDSIMSQRFHVPKMLNYLRSELEDETELHRVPLSFCSVIQAEMGKESREFKDYQGFFNAFRDAFIRAFPEIELLVPKVELNNSRKESEK